MEIRQDSPMIFCLSYKKPNVPRETQKRVAEHWALFEEKRRQNNQYVKDNDVAYVVSFEKRDNLRILDGFKAGYSYNQYLNRDCKNEKDRRVAQQLNFNGIGTWILPVCDNGKTIILGNRKDLAEKMLSGFGGYIRVERDSTNGEISILKHVKNNLKVEMGDLVNRIKKVSYMGLTFCPDPSFPSLCSGWGYSSFNLNCILLMKMSSDEMMAVFKRNEQFSESMIKISSNPESLLKFLEKIKSKEINWEISTSEEMGILNYIGSVYGMDKMKDIISKYSRGNFIKILENPEGNIEFV
jgi:hypothetical protein